MTLVTQDTNKSHMVNDHLNYPDIMPNGLEKYPFSNTRISPIFYEIPENSKVLDIGCNSGEFIKLLKEKKNCDVWGVDVSQGVIDICISKGLTNCMVADAEKLPFEDGTFDVICLMETLEHFFDPVKYLKEMRRVLKKDGILLGSCPHKNLELNVWADERLHHQYYTELSLKEDLYECFDQVYLRVLKGAQFSVGLSNTLMCDQAAEILFKAGGKDTKEWEYDLKHKDVLRVWLGPTQLAGVVYYRMRGFADKMRKLGHEIAYEDFDYDGSESQLKWQLRVGKENRIVKNQLEHILEIADISVWQVVQNWDALAFLMCAKDVLKKPMISEIDDWIFDLPAYNIASNPYQPFSEQERISHKQIEISDILIVSTQYLKDHLNEMFPGKTIYVIPNSIDFDIWDNLKVQDGAPEKKEGVIRIGYTGCGNHDGDLKMIAKPLAKIMQEFPNVDFYYAHPFPSIDTLNDRIHLQNWTRFDEFPQMVKNWNIDIGIAPLRDNNFNRSKSNLRWLEYSALKVPTICSNVYPFKHSVEHEKTGLICSGELEWYEALKALIVDQGKRISLGNQAYSKIKKDFNMDETAKKYAEILKDIKCNALKSKMKLAV